MGLRLSDEDSRRLGGIERELSTAAEALGIGVCEKLVELAPGLTRSGEAPAGDGLLVALDLDHEGPPDALSLCACLAAHRAYVTRRGHPEGVSAGALALARLLVWAQRAAMLGPAPRLRWLGPAPRRPEDPEAVALACRCAVEVGGSTRRAEALALISPPAA